MNWFHLQPFLGIIYGMSLNEHDVFRAWVGLVRGHQTLMDAVEADLKAADLPPLSWYDVLLEINREDGKRLRLQDIGERILLAKNNVTRLVDRLARNDLVRREKSAEDGRGVLACITPKGTELLEKMWPVYRQAVLDHFARHLTPGDISTLVGVFGKLTDRTADDQ